MMTRTTIEFVMPHTKHDAIMRVRAGGRQADFRGAADGSFRELAAHQDDAAYLETVLRSEASWKRIASVFAHYMRTPA